ncbi:GNAT family N-acetyltransferase [soil metagenome]
MDPICQIKPATFNDLAAIAFIQVQAWQQAYVGLLPQAYLDSLDRKTCQQQWEAIFKGALATDIMYVASNQTQPIGFIAFGAARDQQGVDFGEIYAIYLLKEYWGKSIGYGLFNLAKNQLRLMGFRRAYLWVLDTNKQAINAYSKWAGVIDHHFTMDTTIGGQPVKEIMVRFEL